MAHLRQRKRALAAFRLARLRRNRRINFVINRRIGLRLGIARVFPRFCLGLFLRLFRAVPLRTLQPVIHFKSHGALLKKFVPATAGAAGTIRSLNGGLKNQPTLMELTSGPLAP